MQNQANKNKYAYSHIGYMYKSSWEVSFNTQDDSKLLQLWIGNIVSKKA